MRRGFGARFAAGIALLALLASTGHARATDPTVIVLSWDGVRHDYIDRAPLPGLGRLEHDGARAVGLVSVFPTQTFPSHVSLATGAPVDRHGIVANWFRMRSGEHFHFENDARWIEAEPLWVAAERQGVRSAVYFWIGSETDWHGVGATYRRTPFDSGVGEDAKVKQILAWLDLPTTERPRLVMSWWHGADAAGHRYGPSSPEVTAAVGQQDTALLDLLAGLDRRKAWSDTTLIVVSDHGMAEVNECIDLGAQLAKAGIDAEALAGDGTASLWLARPEQRPAVLSLLGKIPGVRAFPAESVPDAMHYRLPERTGDVVVVTEPPRFFGVPSKSGDTLRVACPASNSPRGAHGYDPALPDMEGVFLALGRGVAPATRLPTVRAIDLAPTVARLLGIEPPRDSEGTPIEGIGTAPK